MEKTKFKLSGDNDFSPELKNQVQGLRGSMLEVAERNSLPKRFTVGKSSELPEMVIYDSLTGKSTAVSLYAYSNVREALNNLFGD